MKKYLTLACLVTIAITLGGCSSLFGGNTNQENTESNSEQNKESSNTNDGNYYETMQALMDRGKSMKCTYTQDLGDGDAATGVVYMADKNARVEITTNKGTAHEGKMYSITDQEWSYSWTEGSPNGYKMTLEASKLSEKNEQAISDMTEEINFECKSWKKDNSKFKTPSNIAFEDMSEVMGDLEDLDIAKDLEEAETQANEWICEHCKNAPNPEECLDGTVCD